MLHDPRDANQRGLMRYATVGLEFTFSFLTCLGLGALADRWLGTFPWLMLAGTVLGFAAGLYRLVRVGKEIAGRLPGLGERRDAEDETR